MQEATIFTLLACAMRSFHDVNFSLLWSPDVSCDFLGGFVVSVLCARENFGIVAETYELKYIFCGVYYLTVLIYTKTTIHLSVGG